MPASHLAIGSRVLVRLFEGEEAELGTVVDGPLSKAGQLIFKVRFRDCESWYPAEHLQPYLRVVDE